MPSTHSWLKVLRHIVYFHKNRTHKMQQGLNWQAFQLQVSLSLHHPARRENQV